MRVAIMQGLLVIGTVEQGSREESEMLAAHRGSQSVAEIPAATTTAQRLRIAGMAGGSRPTLAELLATEAIKWGSK